MIPTQIIVDMFCGAGGESTGIHHACEEIGFKNELFAINHWERAIETHSKNYPDANHICEDIDRVDPVKTIKGGKVALLWASPECTHHSNARGGRPRSDQSRISAWQILKWCQELSIQRVIIENVPEFQSWGPLDNHGKPIQKGKGAIFQAWLNSLKSLGYNVDYRVLCCADYGDPTSRKRLFVQAVKGGRKILWPEQSHMESEDLFCDNRWRSAKEIIDWSIFGELISGRKHPLAENTMKRIEAGIRKFWGEYADPFLISLRGTSDSQLKYTSRSIHQPIPTLSAGGGHIALIQPFITQSEHDNRVHSINSPMKTITCSSRGFGLVQPFIIPNFGERENQKPRFHSIKNPLPTVTSHGAGALIQPFVLGQQSCAAPRGVSDPCPTIATKGAISLIQPFLVKYYSSGANVESIRDPLDTVTTKERFALVNGCQYGVLFRMLQPHELSKGQGFPDDYKFAGNKTEIVKQIGNAVPCNTAQALCKSALNN